MNGLYLQDFLQPHTSGEGGVGPNEKTTLCTPHTAPMFLIEQSTTPLRPTEGAVAAGRRTPDCAKEGVEEEFDSNADAEATFPGSSCVTSTSSIVATFLVNDDLIPIKIEKIPGNYKFFNLVFII